MNTLTLNGDTSSLETHMAAYGLAYLIEGSRIAWDANRVEVRTTKSVTEIHDLLEKAVHDALDPDGGWLTDGVETSKGGYISTVSPTVSPFAFPLSKKSPKDLITSIMHSVYADRENLHSRLDTSLEEVVVKTGKPSYWHGDVPSLGGSQLFTHLANATNDQLVTNLLVPCADSKVLAMSGADILDVLTNGADDMFASTEWTPVPTNAVKALFAAYGLWAFPVVHKINDRSYTAGCRPKKRIGYGKVSPWGDRSPLTVEVPLFSTAVSVAKIRSVMSSKNWLEVSSTSGRWLREQGVTSRMVFTSVALQKGQHYASRVGFGERKFTE